MKEYALIIYSAKSQEERFALYREIETLECYDKIENILEELRREFPTIENFSTHFIYTKELDNLHKEDNYFKNIVYLYSLKDFKEIIKSDTQFNYIDLAKLSLLVRGYSKLYLQNIMYFIQESYILMNNDNLLDECFVAYSHGPMLNSFYRKYKYLSNETFEKLTDMERLSLYNRLLDIGIDWEFLELAEKINKKYENKTLTQIYNDGHKPGSPWDVLTKRYGSKCSESITPDLIKNAYSIDT